jgi:tight adherence protein B
MSFLYNDFVFTLVIGALVFVFFYYNVDRILKWLHQRSLGNLDHILQRLDLMFVETDRTKLTYTIWALSFGLGAIVFLIAWPNIILGLFGMVIMTIVGWQIPKLLVDYLYEKRCSTIADQMVDAMTIMANGIKSGLSAPQAMERVVQNMPNPISQEFALVLSQTRLGVSLEEALNTYGTRVPKPDIQMFVISVNILKETGGNMAETFGTITTTIRERQKIQKKIEALTAQGLMQGTILTLVPLVLMGVFFALDPDFIKPLFTTTVGIIFLLVVLALQVIGGLAIRRVVKIQV